MSSPRVVVRAGSPLRGWLRAVAALLVAVALVYAAFEYGRSHAARTHDDAVAERRALRGQLDELERANQALRERVAMLETSRHVDRESNRELEGSLESLQARLQAKQEELQFYQGIVSPEDRVAGLRIERFRVEPRGGPRYQLRMVLTQALRQQSRVEGELRIHVDGSRNGASERLDIATLQPERDASLELDFSFRYFQELEYALVLPEGFRPMSIEIELRPAGRDQGALTRSFDWPGAARPEENE